MALLNVSNKFRERFKSVLFIVVCILVYLWAVVSCLEMWLNCAILDVNSQNVAQDSKSGYLVEVSEIESNGDFYVEGDDTKYTSDDISEYIRVPNSTKYYYNFDHKYFVSKLTLVESRDIMLKFFILDIVCTFILIMLLVYAFKGKLYKKILSCLFVGFSIVMSQFAYEYAIRVLFDVSDFLWVIMFTKVFLIAVVFAVRYFIGKKNKGKKLKVHR